MNLHPKITEARDKVKQESSIAMNKYIGPNHIDNFKLVAVPYIIGLFMEIVNLMSCTALNQEDWWSNGFRNKLLLTSSKTREHKYIELLAHEIAEEIYKENKS